MLQIGDKMPAFEVLDQDGNTVTSQDLIKTGKKTIVYFYPKDNTSGCTAEACSFRDNYAALTAQGYNVVGVSKDSVKSHTGFRAKHGLPFRLARWNASSRRWIPKTPPHKSWNNNTATQILEP